MSTVSAQTLGFTWIASMIAQDSTLKTYAPGGVFADMAPVDAANPYVIVSAQSGTNRLTATVVRIWTEVLYQVKAVGPETQYQNISAAAKRIDTLLDARNQTIAGGIILASWQESPLALSELVAGEKWNNEGGLYRLLIQEV
jgi:hypothetical protein